MPYVPVVDISADPGRVGADLDEICRTVGFFQIRPACSQAKSPATNPRSPGRT